MGPKNWKWIFALLAVFAATAAFTSAIRSPRSDDDGGEGQGSGYAVR